MTQEDKELLLKDLSARLPYKVVAQVTYKDSEGWKTEDRKVLGVYTDGQVYVDCVYTNIENTKPYLRPISSMTEEEFEKLKTYSGLKYEQLDLASYQNGAYKCLDFYLSEVPSYVVILVFDWLNSHHFDFRGLLERGLAIAVTKQNNPYK